MQRSAACCDYSTTQSYTAQSGMLQHGEATKIRTSESEGDNLSAALRREHRSAVCADLGSGLRQNLLGDLASESVGYKGNLSFPCDCGDVTGSVPGATGARAGKWGSRTIESKCGVCIIGNGAGAPLVRVKLNPDAADPPSSDEDHC